VIERAVIAATDGVLQLPNADVPTQANAAAVQTSARALTLISRIINPISAYRVSGR
jgi:hypothetical protein